MSKEIWLDVDGVLLDYTRAFLIFTGRIPKYEDLTNYDLSLLFAGGLEEMLPQMLEFHESVPFSRLAPHVNGIDLLMLKNIGFQLNIITQLDGIHPRYSRIYNLTYTFGDIFNHIVFTSRGQDKAEVLLNHFQNGKPIRVIEDNPTFLNKIDGDERFIGYAIEHPYNKLALKELKHIKSYKDTSDAIQNIMSFELGNHYV